MPVDSNIFQQYLKPVRSMSDYGDDMDKAEANKLTLAASRFANQQAQQSAADDSGMRQATKDSLGDQNKLIQALRAQGNYKGAQAVQKSLLETQKATGEISKDAAQTSKYNADTAKTSEETKYLAATHHAQGIAFVRDIQGVANYADEGISRGIFPPGVRDAMVAEAQTFPSVQAWQAHMEKGAMPVLERYKTAAENARNKLTNDTSIANNTATNATSRANNASSNATTQRGQNMTAGTAAAGRAQSATQHKDTMGMREREIDRGTGGKPMSELQETKYRTQIAKDYQSANTMLSNMDEVAASAKAVKEAPGLGGATGLQAYIPSYPDSEASQAEVKLQNLEGKITNLGKAAASMSGAIGPMAVQEWKIVRDMVAAIDPKKGEKSLKEQIALVEETAAGAAGRIRDAYGKHYGADFARYPQFEVIGGTPKADKPGGGQPIPIKDDAGYNALASGAEFIAPDGSRRRKP